MSCHAPAEPRIPTFAALSAMPAAQLRDAMVEGGKMAPMAAALSEPEKRSSSLISPRVSLRLQGTGPRR